MGARVLLVSFLLLHGSEIWSLSTIDAEIDDDSGNSLSLFPRLRNVNRPSRRLMEPGTRALRISNNSSQRVLVGMDCGRCARPTSPNLAGYLRGDGEGLKALLELACLA